MTTPTSLQDADDYQQIHNGIVRLLDTARTETVRSINALTATYWEIGRRIVVFEQGGESRQPMALSLLNGCPVDLKPTL